MSLERVREEFAREGIEDRIIELNEISATVTQAAKSLHVEEKQIAKTLSFHGRDGVILVVTAGDAKVHSGKFKRTFHIKSSMLNPDEVNTLVGHEIGGVCPFGLNPNVEVYLDETLRELPEVYPACGSVNSAIRLSLEELGKYSHAAGWVDVCKNPQ